MVLLVLASQSFSNVTIVTDRAVAKEFKRAAKKIKALLGLRVIWECRTASACIMATTTLMPAISEATSREG